jgi:hypothetical protein
VFISRDVDGPQLYLSRTEEGIAVRAVGAARAALLLVSSDGIETTATMSREDWTDTFRRPNGRYVRAQLMDEHGQMLALTNALFDW